VFQHVLEQVISEELPYSSQIYKSEEPRNRMIKNINNILEDRNHRAWKTWGFISFLFSEGKGNTKRRSINSIVNGLIKSEDNRPIISIDLSVPGNKRDMEVLLRENQDIEIDEEKDLFTESLQKKIIFRIVSELRRNSENLISERTRDGNKDNVNTLVVFEEAHRFAPKYNESSDLSGKKLTQKLIEGVRETRKYGLAWFFIDQTIGGIHREITQQIRTLWAGFGLSMGDELERLKEIIGGDSSDMNLYQSFKDPASYAYNKDKKFPWMVFGPVSPMVANRPLFLNAFSSNEFSEFNNIDLIAKQQLDNCKKRDIKKKKNKSDLVKGKPKTINGIDDLDDDAFQI
jgi:dephospho-CoA kinase